jgi:adenosylcobinamide-GDP ribazoletransferase
MKAIVDSFFCAFLLYSAIPVPRSVWNMGGVKYALCFKPLVGLLHMVLLLLWYELCAAFAVTPALFAAVAALLPPAVSRGVHLAGLISVADAAASHMPVQKKLMLLAEPRPGASGLLAAMGCLLLQFGLFYQIYAAAPGMLLFPAIGYVASAALSAVSVMIVPPARRSGLGYTLHQGGQRQAALISGAAFYLTAIMLCIDLSFLWGLAAAGICVAVFFLHRLYCVRGFGGSSGALTAVLSLCVELSFSAAAVLAAL